MNWREWLWSFLSILATENIFVSLAVIEAQNLLVVAIGILLPNSKEEVLYHFISKEFSEIGFVGFLTHYFLDNILLATH